MELPPEPILRSLAQRYARLLVKLGPELGTPKMVAANAEHFPDPFTDDEKSVRRLARRMQKHAGMSDIPIKVEVVSMEPADAAQMGSCSSGACAPSAPADQDFARLAERGDDWIIRIPDFELQHPVVLTCNLARALGHLFIVECSDDDEFLRELDVEGELAAVALGFGALLLAGSYIYSKSCGGPSVGKVTKLGTAELAVATALFARVGEHPIKAARRELEATQGELLDEASEWAKSNDALCRSLRDDPARVVRGEFSIEETRPWLVRLFRRDKPKGSRAGQPLDLLSDPSADLADLEAMASTMPDRRKTKSDPDPQADELSSLVAEALSDSRATTD